MSDETKAESEVERAVREAHDECPCRLRAGGDGNAFITDCPTIQCECYGGNLECGWRGHAAITAAILAAVKATREFDAWTLDQMINATLDGVGKIDSDAIRTAPLPSWARESK